MDDSAIAALRFELNKRFTYYGEHFKSPYSLSLPLKYRFSANILLLTARMLATIKSLPASKAKKRIVSNAYFNFSELLKASGYVVSLPPWVITNPAKTFFDFDILRKAESLRRNFITKPFIELLSTDFLEEISQFKRRMHIYFEKHDIAALMVPNDINFFENIAIQNFKELQRPSILSLHGLPSRYNNFDENRTDYLFVWGEAIRANYIEAGVSAEKIFVTGHPKYSGQKQMRKPLRFNLDNILVSTFSIPGAAYEKNPMVQASRQYCIYYMLCLENVLRQIGIKRVRFRPHPSENIDWYRRFLNLDFFIPDNQTLEASLTQATLVIGPTSTLFIEALFYGVNYIFYEPLDPTYPMTGYPRFPPFEGSIRAPLATSDDQLIQIIKSRSAADAGLLDEYIAPEFHLAPIKKFL